ncbi:cysteine desulfurase family protein [Cytobacillus horneckiae]|uniref:cysteine desulfurase family protein n=1 Tax=Cytobacillus horneckiae TaxID=549687 RepID=UPI003D1B3DDE
MIYFDNSATTQPYKEAVDSFVKVSSNYFGNPSSLHGFGEKAERLIMQAREQIADLLGVRSNEIYFTSGGTEGNNMAIKGAALMYRNRGRHIITSSIEHPSVKEALLQLETLGFEVSYLPVDSYGIIDITALEREIREDTILVSIMHINNETGSIQPIGKIGDILKSYPKAHLHVDYVQGIGKVPLNIAEHQIDLCTISSHKFHGLKGTGALFIRDGVHISPLLSGGNQENKMRSGTENTGGIVAMAKALRMTMEEMKANGGQLLSIKTYLMKELGEMEEVIIHTPVEHAAPHIINFSIKGFKAEVFVHALEEKDIYISTTSACSSKHSSVSGTLICMGVAEKIAKSAVRVSLSYKNTMDEAKIFVTAVKKTIIQLRKVMKVK